MAFYSYIPPPPLADFIDLCWLYEGESQPHIKERLLPTNAMELVINLHEDSIKIYDSQDPQQYQCFKGSVLSGLYAKPYIIDTTHQLSVIGVHFKPGGAFPFFPLPVNELQDIHVSLEALWQIKAQDLRDQLLALPTPLAKLHFLAAYLHQQAGCPLVRHPAVRWSLKEFHRADHTRSIADLIKYLGFSKRHFIQMFKEQVGLPPKLFCRVHRFQSVLRHLQTQTIVNWADVAITCGYFDQAHFIHDFKELAGLSPTAYLNQRGEHLNHVPLPV